MTSILFLDNSPRGAASQPKRVAVQLVEDLRELHTPAEVNFRDLATVALPHISDKFTGAIRQAGITFTDHQRTNAAADQLLQELTAADIVVIAAPMINFSIPSSLKAWIDHLSQAGRGLRIDTSEADDLAPARQAYVVTAGGGVYAGDRQAFDAQLPHLRRVLGSAGFSDVKVVEIEGAGFGPAAADKAVAMAVARARELVGVRHTD